MTLWDAGPDLLENDNPLTVTDREPFTDALSENTLGLLVRVAFWIEAEKKVETSRICDYLEYLHVTASNLAERCSQNTFEEHFFKDLTNIDTHTRLKEQYDVKWSFFFFAIGRTFQVMV